MEPFKNRYNQASIAELSKALESSTKNFDAARFLDLALRQLHTLEMKERVNQITEALHAALDSSYQVSLEALVAVIKSSTNPEGLTGFILWPIANYIEVYGRNSRHLSFQGIFLVTKQFTGEFAIRPFIEDDPEDTMKTLLEWSLDPCEHVRRLSSEGARPNLPWGKKVRWLNQNPDRLIAILERLRHDSSLYVRKSVANHLNDISRIDPSLLIKTLRAWDKDPGIHGLWIKRHALRSLLKQGHCDALSLMGFASETQISIHDLNLSSHQVPIGGELELSFALKNEGSQAANLMVDYIIGFRKANGSLSDKVFKLKTVQLKANTLLRIRKKISLKPVTTRTLYAGIHEVKIQVNGKVKAQVDFLLTGSQSSKD